MWTLGLGSEDLRNWRETGSEDRENEPKEQYCRVKASQCYHGLSYRVRSPLTLADSLFGCTAHTLGQNLNGVILELEDHVPTRHTG